jgi:hypothetical protein
MGVLLFADQAEERSTVFWGKNKPSDRDIHRQSGQSNAQEGSTVGAKANHLTEIFLVKEAKYIK